MLAIADNTHRLLRIRWCFWLILKVVGAYPITRSWTKYCSLRPWLSCRSGCLRI